VSVTVWRVEVRPARPEWDALGRDQLAGIREAGFGQVRGVTGARLYFVELDTSEAQMALACRELLADPVTEHSSLRRQEVVQPLEKGPPAVEVHLRPGVMDPVAASTEAALRDMGLPVRAVRTARRYEFEGELDEETLRSIARRVLANDCIEEAFVVGGSGPSPPWDMPQARAYHFHRRTVPVRHLSDDELGVLSRQGHLFLSVQEMKAIRTYYRDLGREPTDVELETFAQTWSEHCVHKTLKSRIIYRGSPMPSLSSAAPKSPGGDQVELGYENLLGETIVAATNRLNKDWCLSVFKDNAGVIAFDDRYGIAVKVETHNHPSAIEPYGGAATGVGGCIRDVIGCGLAARPVANTDVFCLAPPDWPADRLPRGVLHPRRILRGVVAGVRDYGNRMGIPTVNGAIHFDPRYLGNPLVFCGCVGLIPRDRIAKKARPDDRIVLVGGRTGRDGIHGATFSSAELSDTHADEFAHAVQIGNAITEKKFLDCILQARDHQRGCLFSSITDCGAGGLSSAVGEMGAELGAVVDLEKVPLKYQGLRYDEIWISEAQERMVLSVPPENLDALLDLFAAEDVEATIIGRFTDNRRLVVRYQSHVVGELDLDFLHNGRPKTTLLAEWRPTEKSNKQKVRKPESQREGDLVADLKRRLGGRNTASREWVIRQYDHEVQGGSVIKPLVGPGAGPSDAAVIRPRLDSRRGIAIACGLCPQLSDEDPYWMAVAAVDEAVRNVVCVGGDPQRTAILDNFCWGRTDDPRQLGALVRACQGAADAALALGTPFISGKDSLNNEFALDPADADMLRRYLRERAEGPGPEAVRNNRLAIPGTLLVSAVSFIEDVNRCVTMDLKRDTDGHGLWAFWIGWNEVRADAAPALAATAELHRMIHDGIRRGCFAAVHDFCDDDVLTAVAEMAIAGQTGGLIDGEAVDRVCRPSVFGGYIVQDARDGGFYEWLAGQRDRRLAMQGPRWGFTSLGRPGLIDELIITQENGPTVRIPVAELAAGWRSQFNW